MKKETYGEIVRKLNRLSEDEKLEYLKSVIEETDYDSNGLNGELIALYNEYQDNKIRRNRYETTMIMVRHS